MLSLSASVSRTAIGSIAALQFGHAHLQHAWWQKHLITKVKSGGLSLMLWGCFVAGGSVDLIMNKHISAQNLVTFARR